MNITHAHEKVNELSMCGNTTSKKRCFKKVVQNEHVALSADFRSKKL